MHFTIFFFILKIMELFYAQAENISGNSITLDGFEAKHLLTTLRKKAGDTVHVTDGRGKLYITVLYSTRPRVQLTIIKEKLYPRPLPFIGLAIGFIRPNRLDFILEKGTELGVNAFHLVRTENANYMSTNHSRYEKIIRQALKQSVKFHKPELYFYSSLEEFVQSAISRYQTKIAATVRSAPSILPSFGRTYQDGNVLIAIGPEGGFSESEMKMLENDGFLCVSLGDTRLRSETAALSAVAAIQLFIDYMKEASIGTG